MQDAVKNIFGNMTVMMKKLRKTSYEKNMQQFRQTQGHYFDEMLSHIEQSENKELAVKEKAEAFVNAIFNTFEKKGKIRSADEANLNMFMIYYVFPSILLTENSYAVALADEIRDSWRICTKNDRFDYADYDRIYHTFREKIFGLF